MKTWQAVLFAILGTLLATGIVYLVSQPARGAPIQLLPAPTMSPLVIHISGAVHEPGLYQLPPGSRFNDAVQAAGGLLDEADPSRINLAAPLTDGVSLIIPSQAGPEELALPETGSAPSATTRSGAAVEPGLLDINIATVEEFENLPEIGPVIAQRIVEYRQANGPFTTLEAIQNVNGIGPVTFERIRPFITLSNSP